jgi:aryl-alcohol dehydrogenase-like predicted oxidoreductase
MIYRRLGRSGLTVSVLGLGCNTFGRGVDAAGAAALVHVALERGITFFDTADVYGEQRSEEYLGRALAGRRDRAVVATKVAAAIGPGPNDRGASRAHIMDGVHASLRRLGTDYVDLLQIHFWDPHTPLEETLRALDDLVRQGKVRYVGCSNFTAWQLAWALWIADRRGFAPFVSVQPEYSLLARRVEEELLPACLEFGIGVIPYFPLAAGVLTGKYREGEPAPPGTRGYRSERFAQRFATPRNLAIVRRLEAWARDRGRTVGELAIAWLLARPGVATVITGTTKVEQVEANVRAAEWVLAPDEVEEVAALAPREGLTDTPIQRA